MLSGIQVLIVEDEALVAAMLSDAVENAGAKAWAWLAPSMRRAS
ncbi:hypothetical protein [Microvirga sp. VF16]|nr:hypothetical protein [Microvirga sp. VF16]